MTITTDRITTDRTTTGRTTIGRAGTARSSVAGSRSRVGAAERRRRARPQLNGGSTTHATTGHCLPVIEAGDASRTEFSGREQADREFDETSAHFANQPMGIRSLVLWVLTVLVIVGGLVAVANLRASAADAGSQPVGVVEVHNGITVEHAPQS